MRYVWLGLLLAVLTIVILLAAAIWYRWSVHLSLKEKRLILELRGFGFKKKLLDRDFSQPKAKAPKQPADAPKEESPFQLRLKQDKKRIYDPEKGGYQHGGLKEVIGEYLELWEDAKETFRALFDGMRYKIEVTDTRVRVEFGTGNPAHTGMAYGSVWTAIGVIYPMLCRYVKMEYPQIELIPDFNATRFHLEISSIIKVKPAHIIHAALKEGWHMAVTYLRKKYDKGSGKNGRKQTSN